MNANPSSWMQEVSLSNESREVPSSTQNTTSRTLSSQNPNLQNVLPPVASNSFRNNGFPSHTNDLISAETLRTTWKSIEHLSYKIHEIAKRAVEEPPEEEQYNMVQELSTYLFRHTSVFASPMIRLHYQAYPTMVTSSPYSQQPFPFSGMNFHLDGPINDLKYTNPYIVQNRPYDSRGSVPSVTTRSESTEPTEPYSQLIHRPRRIRKGKSVHTRNQSRVCSWCSQQHTPEWRYGPNNITLCNACGLQYRNIKSRKSDGKRSRKNGNEMNDETNNETNNETVNIDGEGNELSTKKINESRENLDLDSGESNQQPETNLTDSVQRDSILS